MDCRDEDYNYLILATNALGLKQNGLRRANSDINDVTFLTQHLMADCPSLR